MLAFIVSYVSLLLLTNRQVEKRWMIMKRLENSSEKIIQTLKVETVGLGFIIS